MGMLPVAPMLGPLLRSFPTGRFAMNQERPILARRPEMPSRWPASKNMVFRDGGEDDVIGSA